MFNGSVKEFIAKSFEDHRGELWTTWKRDEFPSVQSFEGEWVDLDFNHDKISTSRKNVIRGIHGDDKAWKLVTCLYGEIYFVVVDNRKDSDTYLEWDYIILSQSNKKSVLIPPNYGNGHCVLSSHAVFLYKWAYSGEYPDVDQQFSLKWDDKKIGIDWPVDNPVLSKRDKDAMPISDDENTMDFYEMYNKAEEVLK
jgi:dTDP-4-dehydrorhamnose 3,5-epimerase